MKSLRELFRIGKGPSSSHTMGPQKAAKIFASHNMHAASFEVTLYGSLAATGRGHMTDVAIDEVLRPIAPLRIEWQPQVFLPFHPNGMKFVAFDNAGNQTDEWICYSVGGGALSEGEKGRWLTGLREVYKLNTLREIQDWCESNGRGYWEYVNENEDEDIWDYLMDVWQAMKESVERGIDHEGALPGPLNLPRKGPIYYVKASGYMETCAHLSMSLTSLTGVSGISIRHTVHIAATHNADNGYEIRILSIFSIIRMILIQK